MKIIIHDMDINFSEKISEKADKIIIADGRYAPCQGCFKCWTKHPASCELKDSLNEISRMIGQADELIIITENCYGGHSPNIKRILDRGIGISTPMSTYRGKLMHHTLRYGKHDTLRVFVYGDVSEKEKETWKLMIKSNSLNNGFRKSEVIFTSEAELKEGKII